MTTWNEANKQMEKKTAEALIIGAGIAGPALGIALRRVGIESVIYEANQSPRDEAGAFLNLAPNGLNALRAIGLGDLTTSLGFRNDRLERRVKRNKPNPPMPYSTSPNRLCICWRAEPTVGQPGSQGQTMAPR